VIKIGAPLVIVGAVVAAYAGSFAGVFVFDDFLAILQNPTIRHFGTALFPPSGQLTVSGRPLFNFSLALSYALSGNGSWGYHALNLLIHLGAALALFGIARRTLRSIAGAEVEISSLAIALWWALHPLHTESVTYMVQRAESLMGLCYFLSVYGFIRWVEAPGPRSRFAWAAVTWLACACGMACKEDMASAPFVIFVYDRIFVTKSWAEAWRRHRGLHLALAATWIELALLVLSNGANRGGSVGVGLGIPWGPYLLTQFQALALYLRLSFWPHPLIFDYGAVRVSNWAQVVPGMILLVTIAAGTGWGLRRGRLLGLLGLFFLGILAPTFLVPVTAQTIAEHRMYLPLAAIVVVVVAAANGMIQRRPALALTVVAAVALGLGFATDRRNRVYRSGLSIWGDTVAHWPKNSRAHSNLGTLLLATGDLARSASELQQALDLHEVSEALVRINLGIARIRLGQTAAAEAQLAAAERIEPDNPEAHYNRGVALAALNRTPEAIAEFRTTVRLRPESASAHENLATLLWRAGEADKAIIHFRQSVALEPQGAAAQAGLGSALAIKGQYAEAISHLEVAAGLDPTSADVESNWGNCLLFLGRAKEAIGHYQAALRLRPGDAGLRRNLQIAEKAASR